MRFALIPSVVLILTIAWLRPIKLLASQTQASPEPTIQNPRPRNNWFKQLTNPQTISQTFQTRLITKLADAIIAIVIWQLRWLIITPLEYAWKYAFSWRFRDLRRVSGRYYLYHRPLWTELAVVQPVLGTKIRASILEIKIGLKTNKAVQKDLFRPDHVGYSGTADFKREFIYIRADGVMDRYQGNRKTLTLYRQYLAAGTPKSRKLAQLTFGTQPPLPMGTCGVMTGIANNSNIYRVAVVLSRFPLSPENATSLLDLLETEGITVAVGKRVRREIEIAPANLPQPSINDFDTPFG